VRAAQEDRNRRAREERRAIDAKRIAAGKCRHCGGPLPCWSAFGDRSVGRFHTDASLRKVRGFDEGGASLSRLEYGDHGEREDDDGADDGLDWWPNCSTPDCALKVCLWAGTGLCAKCSACLLGEAELEARYVATHAPGDGEP
jgi:hypothetical protein